MEDGIEKRPDTLLAKLRKILKKGDKKSTTFAAEEALKFYKRSLDNLEKGPETPENLESRAETLLLLSEILYILGRWDTAITHLEKVIAMGPKKAGTMRTAEAQRRAGNLWALKGDIDKTFESYTKALQFSRELGDKSGVADAERGLGYAYWRRGNISEAETHYNAAFKALEGSNDEDLLAKTYLESGNVYNDKGDLNRSVNLYMKSIRVFRKVHDIYQEARGYNNLGDVCIKRRDWKKGIKYFEKCAALAESINDLHMQGWALFNAAECQAKGGNLEEADASCTKALDMLSRIDDKIGIAYVFCNYGIVYRFKKEWAKSTKYFKFSLNIVKNLRTAGLEAYVLKEYAEMLNDWGKKDKAQELAVLARNIYSTMGAKFYVEMMNELMARIEGKSYQMDISLSQETMDAMDKEYEEPMDEPVPMVQTPVVFAKARSAEPLFSDEGPVNTEKRPIRAGPITMARPVEGPPEEKVQPTAPEPPAPEPQAAKPAPEEVKLYLFMPKEEDEELRAMKVKLYVELPFAAPDIEVEEIKEGERPDLAKDVVSYPSVMLFGKVHKGIPPVKELLAEMRSKQRDSRGPAPMRALIPGGGRARRQPARSAGPSGADIGTHMVEERGSGQETPAAAPEPRSIAPPGLVPRPVAVPKFHYSYLVEGEDDSRAFEALKAVMASGAKGLCVTRPPVRRIKDEFGLEGAEFLLLSTSDVPREGQHLAKDLDGLAKKIEAFMEASDSSAVLLDRSEVLLGAAGLDAFVRLVHRLNESLEICKCCLLVQMDTHTIKEADLRALRRELTKF
jgi:tetratricopeptide (TPR) repeat protein